VKKRSVPSETDGQILLDHIRELRMRIIVCAVVLIAGGVVGYLFYAPILGWLRSPLGTDLYYSTPAGSFNFILKVSTMVGIFAAVPFIIYQLIMFVQPVFKNKLSTPRVLLYTAASIFLAAAGGLFAFFVILPGALKFFAGFQVAGLSALIDANNYLNFVTNAIVTFILVFQIPLIMIIIDRIKPIPPKKLLSFEKYVVIGGLLVSLVVPFAMDLTTSLLIASPIVILYNISVVMIVARHAVAKRRARRQAYLDEDQPGEMPMNDTLISEFFAAGSEPVDETSRRGSFGASAETDILLNEIMREQATTDDAVRTLSAPSLSTVRHNTGAAPLHVKPRPGQISVEVLRAEARAKREKEIAERVAAYNNPSLKIINDIQ